MRGRGGGVIRTSSTFKLAGSTDFMGIASTSSNALFTCGKKVCYESDGGAGVSMCVCMGVCVVRGSGMRRYRYARGCVYGCGYETICAQSSSV